MNSTKVITGANTRWSYIHVLEPNSINGSEPKYSVSLIIPKSDKKTVVKIKAAIQAAYDAGQAKLKGNGRSVPQLTAIKSPLRDGDLERPDDAAYADSYFINANNKSKPGLDWYVQVSGRSEITDFEEVVKLDTKYISEWSFMLDIKILFKLY